jgi:hypothetical protein
MKIIILTMILGSSIFAGQHKLEQNAEQHATVTVTGVLKGVKGTISHNGKKVTFGKLKANTSIIISPKEAGELKNFQTLYKKKWIKTNTYGPRSTKKRLCFKVTGIVHLVRGRAFIYPTSSIEFYTYTCKAEEDVPLEAIDKSSIPVITLELEEVEPPTIQAKK